MPGAVSSDLLGVPYEVINGADVATCYERFSAYTAAIREDRKPRLLVLQMERLGDHTNGDDQTRYRSKSELESGKQRDPIVHWRNQLSQFGVSAARLTQIEQEVTDELNQACQNALSAAAPIACLTAKSPLPSAWTNRDEFRGIDDQFQVTMCDSINHVLRIWLERDSRVFLFGQDIEDPKGDVFGVTKGLSTQFPGRVKNAPLSESTILGTSIGRAVAGQRPVAFLQFADFLPLAANQLWSELATLYWRSVGKLEAPVIVMAACGAYKPGLGPFHAETMETFAVHSRGVDVMLPSTAGDAAGLLQAAFQSGRPTLFLYPKSLLRNVDTSTSNDVSNHFVIPGKGRIVAAGHDVTLVSWGTAMRICVDAVARLNADGISCELIDLRALSPWDADLVLNSAQRTGKLVIVHEDSLTCGFGAEVAATISERSSRALTIRRVARPDTFIPCNFENQLEMLPSAERVTKTIKQLFEQATIESDQNQNPRLEVVVAPGSPSDDEVLVLRLLVKAGDRVEVGQELAEIETSKAVQSVASHVGGIVDAVLVTGEDQVRVGQSLIRIRIDQVVPGKVEDQRSAFAKSDSSHQILDRTIAAHAPQATLSIDLDWRFVRSRAAELRLADPRLPVSNSDIIFHALAFAAGQHQAFRRNHTKPESTTCMSGINLGIAVGLPDDRLEIAVVENADRLTAAEFVQRLHKKILLVREGVQEDSEPADLIITFLPGLEIRSAVPMLAPNCTAVVFVGEPLGRAVDEALLTITFDHSRLNGMGAAKFLATARKKLADPICHINSERTVQPAKDRDQIPAAMATPLVDSHQEIEQCITSLVQDLLPNIAGIIGLDRPLRNMGIDSNQAEQLLCRLGRRFECQLPSGLVYRAPTIRQLAEYIRNLQEGHSATQPRPLNSARASNNNEPIAIVGMNCRLPMEINDIGAFWKFLIEGRDGISPLPEARQQLSGLQVPASMSSHDLRGGYLSEIDEFDADSWGISSREAITMDPQHRILLTVIRHALKYAGLPSLELSSASTGLFIGMRPSGYDRLSPRVDQSFDIYPVTGNFSSTAVGRISHLLNLQGPSLALDTACSSSLVAVHQACESLRQGESGVAIAGGINLLLSYEETEALRTSGILSKDGNCRVFDASADGYVRSEGCGIVILKRLSDAERDGNRIWAVITGSAINHNGGGNGLTAPNGAAQERVIRTALRRAQLQSRDVEYIESHGTGTRLGDAVEVEAIANAYAKESSRQHPLIVGAVKTNFGHLEYAAGIIGLIKAALALQFNQIPQNLHLTQLNPRLTGLPGVTNLVFPSIPQSFQADQRRAAVSSFGFGGTNAHLILEAFGHSIPEVNLPIEEVSSNHAKSYWWPSKESRSNSDCIIPTVAIEESRSRSDICLIEISEHNAVPENGPDDSEVINELNQLAAAWIRDAARTVPIPSLMPSKSVRLPSPYCQLVQESCSKPVSFGLLENPASLEMRLSSRFAEYEHEIRLLGHVGRHLPQLWQGTRQAMDVLFSETSYGLREFYRKSFCQSELSDQIARKIVEMACRYTTPIRILEVGAGVGATTQRVLGLLDAKGIAYDYLFTDIAVPFVEEAAQTWSGRREFHARTFDVTASPLGQGLVAQQFDVIIAANVLHATKDLEASLRHCVELLSANGAMLVLEVVEQQLWLDCIFGLIPSWWRKTDPDNSAWKGAPRDIPTWKECFHRTGLQVQELLNPPRFGHQLFYAEKAVQTHRVLSNPTVLNKPLKVPCGPGPLPSGGTSLAEQVLRFLQEHLGLCRDLTDFHRPLRDFGVDSIHINFLAAWLSKELGIHTPMSAIDENLSLARLTEILKDGDKTSATRQNEQLSDQFSICQQPDLSGVIKSRDQSRLVGPLTPMSHAPQREHGLTPLQHEIIAAEQIAGTSSPFNESFGWQIEEAISAERLTSAVCQVISKHRELRTVFRRHDGEWRQGVLDSVKPELIDLASFGFETSSGVENLVTSQATRRFDLQNGPLIRFLYLMSENRTLLYVNAHHLIVDLRSLIRIVMDLSQALDNQLEPVTLEKSFQEYVSSRKDAGPARLSHCDTTACSPIPKSLQLPDFSGVECVVSWDSHLVELVDQAVLATASTRCSFLLACLMATMTRYRQLPKVEVDFPADTRPDIDYQNSVGCFIEIGRICLTVTNDLTFEDLVQITKHQIADQRQRIRHGGPQTKSLTADIAFLWESVTLGEISGAALFAPISDVSVRIGERMWQTRPVPSQCSKFPLVARFHPLKDQVHIVWQAWRREMSVLQLQAVADLLGQFVRQAARKPSARISQIWECLENLSTDATLKYRSPSFLMRFATHLASAPFKTAVIDGNQTLTYQELDQTSNWVAQKLVEFGVKPGARVAILLDKGICDAIAVLGIWKARGTVLPLSTLDPNPRLGQIVSDAEPDICLTTSNLASRLPDGPRSILLDEFQTGDFLATEPSDGEVAYLIYTSGSSGEPKGVMIEHRNLPPLLDSFAELISFTGQDVFASPTALSFDIAFLELLLPLSCGGTTAMVSSAMRADCTQLPGYLDRVGATHFQATPDLWLRLCATGWTGRQGLRALCGGDRMSAELAQQLHSKCLQVWNVYGPTETTVWATAHEVDGSPGPVPIGRALPGVYLLVCDELGNKVTQGQLGELWIGGWGVARGYWKLDHLTQEKFVLEKLTGNRFYRTGDIVSRESDGTLHFHGRNDRQVKFQGQRIELEEIEHRLEAVSGVHQAAVVFDEAAGRLTAYLAGSTEMNQELLRGFLARELPPTWIPSMTFMDSLPKTSNGKVDRKTLVQKHSSDSPRENRSSDEWLQCIIETWRQVTGGVIREPTYNFAVLGGNSSQIVEFMTVLSERNSINAKPEIAFQFPTPKALSQHLAEYELTRHGGGVNDASDGRARASRRRVALQQLKPL